MLCLVCLTGVSCLLCGFSLSAMGLSAVCDCDISQSYSLTFLGVIHANSDGFG